MADRGGPGSLFRAAGVVSLFTLLSRIFGFVRDMVIAYFFGARAVADAFFVAFRIPNLLRRLTAEGAMSAAFVPEFSKTLKRDREEAIRLANNMLATLTVVVTGIVVLGIIFSPELLTVIAYGFTDDPEKFEKTVLLTRLMFPYLLFISLAAIVMGILNSMGHFAAPAASPVMLNLSIILATFLLHERFEEKVYALVVGVLLGGVLQLAIQVPFAVRQGFRFFWHLDWQSPGLRRVFALTVPALFGIAVAEINMFVDTVLASLLADGSVSYLYYGNRLVQFPLGVFGIAMSTALLPKLSHQSEDRREMVRTFSQSVRGMMFLIIPSTVGLIVLREPIIRLLFERGEFDVTATVNTSMALLYYTVGLLAFSGVKLAAAGFYAMGDTKTPVKIASIAMLLNIVLNLALMGPLKHGGLALATSLSSFVNFFLLLYVLRGRFGGMDGKRMLKSFALLSAASLIMAAFIYGTWGSLKPETVPGLIASIGGGAAVFVLSTFALRMEEAKRFKSFLSGKLKKR